MAFIETLRRRAPFISSLVAVLALACSSASAKSQEAADADGALAWVAVGPSWGLSDFHTDLSGISWASDSNSYLLVQNDGKRIYEYEEDLKTLRRVVWLRDALDFDFEGIAALPGGRVAIANERNQIYVFAWPEGREETTVSLDPQAPEVDFLQLPPRARWNQGIEGLCFDPAVGVAGALYAFQESNPLRFFRVFLSERGALAQYDEPFDAQARLSGIVRDISGCAVDRERDTLLLISHLSSSVVAITKDGALLAEMKLPGLADGGASQYEGIEIGPGRRLVLASEPFLGTWPSRVRGYRWVSSPGDSVPAAR